MTATAPILEPAHAAPPMTVTPHDGDPRLWDDFVQASPASTFCHLAGWRTVMEDTLGHECLTLVARDDTGGWHGVLPLVRVKHPLFGHYLVSMPFLNAGGPLGEPTAVSMLLARAIATARRSWVDLLEIRARESMPDALRPSHRKITVHLPLPANADALWRAFPAKLRSQIRRPQKEGFETRFGLDQRDAFYEVFARGMRALGTPVLPRAFFDRIAAVFPDQVECAVVYRGDEPIAAGCGFVWRNTFELTWAASLLAYRRQAPNMLLYWALMERMIARGVRVFDFGRCTPGGGTHVFKRQWGGTDVPLPWAQWSRGETVAPPSPDRPLFRYASACWRRLPLSVTNRVGPLLARGLP